MSQTSVGRPGLGLIIIGGLFVGIGLGLVQAGIRRSQGCVNCDDDETIIDKVAEAGAELKAEEE